MRVTESGVELGLSDLQRLPCLPNSLQSVRLRLAECDPPAMFLISMMVYCVVH